MTGAVDNSTASDLHREPLIHQVHNSTGVWCLSEQWLCQCKGLWLARLSDAGNVHSPLLAFALKAQWLWLHGSIHTMLGLIGSELKLLQCLDLFFEQGLWFCGTTLALPQQV